MDTYERIARALRIPSLARDGRAQRPRRRGPLDPTWLTASVGVIGLGALIVAVAGTAHPASQGANSGVLIAGIVIAAVGVIGVLGCGVDAFVRLREDSQSPFLISHYPNCPDCRESLVTPSGPAEQLRIHVTNASRSGVERVRAFLHSPDGKTREHFLHIQHDNDATGARQLSRMGENLTVGQPVHFDLVLVSRGWPDGSGGTTAGIVRFEYADPAISDMSQTSATRGAWLLRIEVSGWTDFRDVVPRFREYQLSVDSQRRASLVQL